MVRKYLLFPAGIHWLRRMLTRIPMQVYSKKCAIFRTGCSKLWTMALFADCVQFLWPTMFTTSTHRSATSVLTLPDFFPSWAEKEKIIPYNTKSKMPLRIDTESFRFLSSVTHAFITFITLFIFFLLHPGILLNYSICQLLYSFTCLEFAGFSGTLSPSIFHSIFFSLVLYYTRSSLPKQPSFKNLHKILHNLLIYNDHIFSLHFLIGDN